MLEWYRTDADYLGILADTDAGLRRLLALSGRQRCPTAAAIQLAGPWPLTVRDAYRRLGRMGSALVDADRFDMDMVTRIEPRSAARNAVRADRLPGPAASLARLKPGDASFARQQEFISAGLNHECLQRVVRRRRATRSRRARTPSVGQRPIHGRALFERARTPACRLRRHRARHRQAVMLACDTDDIAMSVRSANVKALMTSVTCGIEVPLRGHNKRLTSDPRRAAQPALPQKILAFWRLDGSKNRAIPSQKPVS